MSHLTPHTSLVFIHNKQVWDDPEAFLPERFPLDQPAPTEQNTDYRYVVGGCVEVCVCMFDTCALCSCVAVATQHQQYWAGNWAGDLVLYLHFFLTPCVGATLTRTCTSSAHLCNRDARTTAQQQPIVRRYIPFSGGPRKCVGDQFAIMEAVVALAVTLKRFDFSLVPGQQINMTTGATIHTTDGLYMTMKERRTGAGSSGGKQQAAAAAATV